MAYPIAFWRLILKGFLFDTQDWSVGIGVKIDAGASYSYEIMQAWLEAEAGAFVTFYNALSSIRSSQCTFETLRVEQYNGADSPITINETPVTGTVVGSTVPLHPATTAMAVGLMTNRPGASYRGRIYIPALSAQIQAADGYLSAATQTTVRNAVAALITAVNAKTVSGSPMRVHVGSRLLGTSRPVQAVRSDQLLDVQRRRNNDFGRNYTQTLV